MLFKLKLLLRFQFTLFPLHISAVSDFACSHVKYVVYIKVHFKFEEEVDVGAGEDCG